MRTRMFWAVVVAAALAMGTASAAQAQTQAGGGTLYLQSAGSGTLHDGRLTLHGVALRTTTFQDRPARTARSQTTRSFASQFARTFGDDPPNAALEIQGAPASRDVVLLELRHPRYDRRAGTLTYDVTPLKDTDSTALASFGRRNDGVRSHSFGRSTLFIDDGDDPDGLSVRFDFTVPAGTTASLTLSNCTFDYNTAGVSVQAVDVGAVQLNATTISLTAGAADLHFIFATTVDNITQGELMGNSTGETWVNITPSGGPTTAVFLGSGAWVAPLQPGGLRR